ncbi:Rieske 2Fe-2S domain-containing protein [bacterium]|nr:Rieske 2Fe-2S domain-containing protein [bacterium]
MAKSSKVSRRNFLTSTLAASSGLVLGSLVPLGSLQTNGLLEKLPERENSLIIDLEDYPELKEAGGFKILKEVAIGEITDSIIIVRKSDTDFLVYSSVCRHKKCNVKYKKERDLFVCPCHGSTYDINGKVIKGPSQGDIPKYKTKLINNTLEISN